MTKKQSTFYSVCGLLIGLIVGIAGTAHSFGVEEERINNALVSHSKEIAVLKTDNRIHETSIQTEMDRLHRSITELTNVVSNLRTDVQVIKALMERMEKDINNNIR